MNKALANPKETQINTPQGDAHQDVFPPRSVPSTGPSPLAKGMMLAQRFRLVREAGRGGLGQVWLAEDAQLDDELVACKILREDLFYDRRAIADMKREVLLTRKLRHEFIMGVYTFFETEAERFITMEYIEGQNLLEKLTRHRKPFPLDEVLPWADQLCQALDYAHRMQILHRDVKPGNIIIATDNTARLIDFGIARTAQEVRTRFTGEMTCGTLLYMSPEQLMCETLDARADLYSLAASLYELLSGAPPFYQGSLITQIQMKPPSPIKHLPEPINNVLLKALSKNPDHRHPSCGAFGAELKRAAQGITSMDLLPASVAAAEAIGLPAGVEWFPDKETVRLHTTIIEARKPRIGMLLVEAGIVSAEQLEEALRVQEETEEKLGSVLVRLGYVAEEVISDAVGAQLQVPFIRLDDQTFDPAVTAMVKPEVCRKRCAVPIRIENDQVLVAMADPLDLGGLNELERIFKRRVDQRIAPFHVILAKIEAIYGPEVK